MEKMHLHVIKFGLLIVLNNGPHGRAPTSPKLSAWTTARTGVSSKVKTESCSSISLVVKQCLSTSLQELRATHLFQPWNLRPVTLAASLPLFFQSGCGAQAYTRADVQLQRSCDSVKCIYQCASLYNKKQVSLS